MSIPILAIVVTLAPTNLQSLTALITPRAHARARGYVIGRGVYISAKLFSIFQNTHFQTPISAQEGFSSNLIAFSIP